MQPLLSHKNVFICSSRKWLLLEGYHDSLSCKHASACKSVISYWSSPVMFSCVCQAQSEPTVPKNTHSKLNMKMTFLLAAAAAA